MKTELRARPHEVLKDQQVFELWYEGQFIAEVTGADGPGVRVLSKHPLVQGWSAATADLPIKVVEIRIAVVG